MVFLMVSNFRQDVSLKKINVLQEKSLSYSEYDAPREIIEDPLQYWLFPRENTIDFVLYRCFYRTE